MGQKGHTRGKWIEGINGVDEIDGMYGGRWRYMG